MIKSRLLAFTFLQQSREFDIMVPMAIPSFGGMLIEIMTMLVLPVLYCSVMEWKLNWGIEDRRFEENAKV